MPRHHPDSHVQDFAPPSTGNVDSYADSMGIRMGVCLNALPRRVQFYADKLVIAGRKHPQHQRLSNSRPF